jgi:hypothetical protein
MVNRFGLDKAGCDMSQEAEPGVLQKVTCSHQKNIQCAYGQDFTLA